MPAIPPTVPVRLSQLPAYSMLAQFPVAFFTGALATDLAYMSTGLYLWETFSVWLLSAGCLLAGVAAVVAVVGFLRHRRSRGGRLAWPQALTSLLVLVLSIVNTFVHSRDGYTAVVPDGLTLSVIVVLLMFAVAWMGHGVRRVPSSGVAA